MFNYSYQHDSSRVKEVDCMNDLFCAAEQVKNINYVSSPFSPEKQMKIMLVITSFGKMFLCQINQSSGQYRNFHGVIRAVWRV